MREGEYFCGGIIAGAKAWRCRHESRHLTHDNRSFSGVEVSVGMGG